MNVKFAMSLSAFPKALAALGVLLALAVSGPAAAQEETPQGDVGEPVKILAFGDSLVHGYGLRQNNTFPAQLERALRDSGIQAEVINSGNSGDTTESGRARLDWVLHEGPDAVIVVLGANDALRGIDPSVTERNLERILERLQNRGLPTLLAGMKAPRNMGSEYVEEFDSIYPMLAEKYDTVFYPFFLEDVAGDPELNQGDGIHPNPKGVGVIVDNILPDVKTLIERVRTGEPTG